MKSGLSASDLRVLLFIVRKTYGWSKQSDKISYTQIQEATGISRPLVSKAVQRMTHANIIITAKGFISGYGINTDTASWITDKKLLVENCTPEAYQKLVKKTEPVSKTELVKKTEPPSLENLTRIVKKTEPKLVKKTKPTKERKDNIKDTNTKEKANEKKSFGNSDINTIVEYLELSLGHKLDGTIKENRQYAYNLIRKVKSQEPDNYIDLIKAVIDIGVEDGFHSRNLTSMKYLYYNFAKIGRSATIRKTNVVKIA